MTSEVVVMVGVPGSGKSTWIEQEAKFVESEHKTIAVISRDAVRKSFVGDGEYFSKEDEVFREFIRQINECMEIGVDTVFVDATHISPASRAKLLRNLRPDASTALTFMVIDCGKDTCKARNSLRKGFTRVPDSAIDSMCRGYRPPVPQEFANTKYGFKEINIKHYDNNTEKE